MPGKTEICKLLSSSGVFFSFSLGLYRPTDRSPPSTSPTSRSNSPRRAAPTNLLSAYNDPAVADLRTWRIVGFPNHLIFCRPLESGTEVIRVLHAKRDIEALFERSGLTRLLTQLPGGSF